MNNEAYLIWGQTDRKNWKVIGITFDALAAEDICVQMTDEDIYTDAYYETIPVFDRE